MALFSCYYFQSHTDIHSVSNQTKYTGLHTQRQLILGVSRQLIYKMSMTAVVVGTVRYSNSYSNNHPRMTSSRCLLHNNKKKKIVVALVIAYMATAACILTCTDILAGCEEVVRLAADGVEVA